MENDSIFWIFPYLIQNSHKIFCFKIVFKFNLLNFLIHLILFLIIILNNYFEENMDYLLIHFDYNYKFFQLILVQSLHRLHKIFLYFRSLSSLKVQINKLHVKSFLTVKFLNHFC